MIPEADVCLLLEGTYPFVSGGVSSWTHDLITAHSDLSFTLFVILPPNQPLIHKYQVPDNVVHIHHYFLNQLPEGKKKLKNYTQILKKLEQPLLEIQSHGDHLAFKQLIEILAPYHGVLGTHLLLNSPEAWKMLQDMYYKTLPKASFLDYFWSWRGLLTGLYSMLLAPLPQAKIYHSVSTGYAGLLLARAVWEYKRPALLTEHGIYTNERRIEIALADWLYEIPHDHLNVDKTEKQLRDLWIDSFISYSRICYQATSQIITLYEGNQQFQRMDDAPIEKLRVIPNGVDYEKFSTIVREVNEKIPVVVLIGRVVPIKDIKTFLRAAQRIHQAIPEVEVWILGPTEEDEEYFNECQHMVEFLKLEKIVTFKGKVNLVDYLGKVDVIVLTSISEAQPLVILEAGASGIPSVTTNVGACKEMILGRPTENPQLGPGGAITSLASPDETAAAVIELINDKTWYQTCGQAIQQRTRDYYNKKDLDKTYRQLYLEQIEISNKSLDSQICSLKNGYQL